MELQRGTCIPEGCPFSVDGPIIDRRLVHLLLGTVPKPFFGLGPAGIVRWGPPKSKKLPPECRGKIMALLSTDRIGSAASADYPQGGRLRFCHHMPSSRTTVGKRQFSSEQRQNYCSFGCVQSLKILVGCLFAVFLYHLWTMEDV